MCEHNVLCCLCKCRLSRCLLPCFSLCLPLSLHSVPTASNPGNLLLQLVQPKDPRHSCLRNKMDHMSWIWWLKCPTQQTLAQGINQGSQLALGKPSRLQDTLNMAPDNAVLVGDYRKYRHTD